MLDFKHRQEINGFPQFHVGDIVQSRFGTDRWIIYDIPDRYPITEKTVLKLRCISAAPRNREMYFKHQKSINVAGRYAWAYGAPNKAIQFLLWLGLVRYLHNGRVRWPVSLAPLHAWTRWPDFRATVLSYWRLSKHTLGFYRFRNLPEVVKWEEGRLLPKRWGGGFLGLIEIGDRG